MRLIAMKTGGITAADNGNFPQISHSGDASDKNGGVTRTRLRRLAREVFSEISLHKEDLAGAACLAFWRCGKN